MKTSVLLSVVLLLIVALGFWWIFSYRNVSQPTEVAGKTIANATPTPPPKHPLSIEAMRAKEYPGSEFVIEETLPPGSNYKRYIASFKSDGLKINGLLTIPNTEAPEGGFPAIIFNHGYIPPEVYRPTERYIAYVDLLAKSGFILFRPDYRGHASSEGNPEGAYFSPGYTVDVLNAFSSVQKMKEVNPKRVGMWGHSLGGFITQKAMVIDPEIKAGVIWGGVVGTYEDMFTYWWNKRTGPWRPSQLEQATRRSSRQDLVNQYGEPKDGNPFWAEISAANYIKDISGPVQIHHGTADEEVPYELAERLKFYLDQAGKPYEFYSYPGGNHDIADPNFTPAMQRTIDFFKKNL